MTIPYETLYKKMQMVLQSKLEELQLYEYQDVTLQQLWQFCVEKKWRKRQIEEIRPHEMVATIFSITPTDLMQYAQAKQYHYHDGIVEINLEELNLLMGRSEDETL